MYKMDKESVTKELLSHNLIYVTTTYGFYTLEEIQDSLEELMVYSFELSDPLKVVDIKDDSIILDNGEYFSTRFIYYLGRTCNDYYLEFLPIIAIKMGKFYMYFIVS